MLSPMVHELLPSNWKLTIYFMQPASCFTSTKRIT